MATNNKNSTSLSSVSRVSIPPPTSGEILYEDLSREQQRHLARELSIDVSQMRAKEWKNEIARVVMQRMAMKTLVAFDEFLDFARPLLDKVRHSDDQAQFEDAYQKIYDGHSNNLGAILTSSGNALAVIVDRPISRPELPEPEEPEPLYIDVPPTFWGKIRGEQPTRVRLR